MKKKKLTMTVLLVCLIALAVLSGCQISGTMLGDNYKDEGFYKVTLYYNGGTSDGNYYHHRFIPQNSRLPYPGASGSPLSNPVRPAHTLAGWYQLDDEYFDVRQVNRTKTVVDEHGVTSQEPVYDQAKNPVIDDQYFIKGFNYHDGEKTLGLTDLEDNSEMFVKKWNFEIDRVKDDIVLVAIWKSTREYTYIAESDSLIDPNDEYFKGKTSGGKYEYTWYMNDDGSISRPRDLNASDIPQVEHYQVEGLYLDNRFLNEIPFDPETGLYYPEETYTDGQIDRFPIYVRYISKNYTIVNSINDLYYDTVTREYTFHTNADTGGFKSLYVRANIDLEGNTLNFRNTSSGGSLTFSADIRGNGHTLSNFVVNITQRNATSFYGGVFGIINNANIQNITFDSFTVNFRRVSTVASYLTQTITINALADSIPASATLRDVRVTNMRVIDQPATTFGTYSFKNDGENPRIETYNLVDDSGNPYQMHVICRNPGAINSGLRSYIITDEDKWSSRTSLSLAQYGNNFDSDSTRVVNCSAAEPTLVEWHPDYIKSDITNANYYLLPNLPSVTDREVYMFYGWFTEYGYQYGPGHPAPAEGESLTLYAMFVMV